MSILDRPLTYDDLLQLPEDGNRVEIIDGEPIVRPAPTLKHQTLSRRLFLVVNTEVDAGGLG